VVKRIFRRYAGLMSVGRRPQREVRPLVHLTELDRYEGRWVAVREGHVVADADSSASLARALREAGELRGTVMQFVQPEAQAFIVGVG
jgi:Family of unknown function (DUF5678)